VIWEATVLTTGHGGLSCTYKGFKALASAFLGFLVFEKKNLKVESKRVQQILIGKYEKGKAHS
jgi:hypothetical protein